MDRKVSIAMCTYNGARYVEAQLESLAGQTRRPDELVVCDDGSDDETPDLIDRFARRAPFQVRVFRNETNLGPCRNFEQALSLCKGAAVFFCDQDDIWLPEKIEKVINRLAQAERKFGPDTPILVHSNLEVVDENLLTVHESFVRYYGFSNTEPNLLSIARNNVVTGCASALNRTLVDKMIPFPKSPTIDIDFLHDWWSAICAACLGHIIFIDENLVKYRIHQNNAVGFFKENRKRKKRIISVNNKYFFDFYIKDKNKRAIKKIKRHIEYAKCFKNMLEERNFLDLKLADHRFLVDAANLDVGVALSRIPKIWRTRFRGGGVTKNIRRGIRILLL